ncbi:RNA polymerase sigma factor [Arcticibacter eurypsychrophilus]|uniref:RNA polymerase sigma factor n=1 Tax=Arcticibacter eurypsychrophilus TaxID=1434752 RepID=UPI001480117D|nr:sigma-70 family RNA polymerase sigma factor [Arcticibacter eurypsychrophilus]
MKPHALKFTRDEDDAKDLIQDTLIKAIINWDKFRDDTNIKGWLFIIMRNLFVNQYRKKKYITCPIEHEEGVELRVNNTAESNMNVQYINSLLGKLPFQYKQPLQMFINGYKYNEINDILKGPIGTTKNRIHKARKILIKALLSEEN